jgi:hypothetical protein
MNHICCLGLTKGRLHPSDVMTNDHIRWTWIDVVFQRHRLFRYSASTTHRHGLELSVKELVDLATKPATSHRHGLELSFKGLVDFAAKSAISHRHGLELSVKGLVDFAAKSAISHRHGLELSCKNFVEFKVLFFLIDVGIN